MGEWPEYARYWQRGGESMILIQEWLRGKANTNPGENAAERKKQKGA